MNWNELETSLEQRDSSHGAPLLECLVVGLALLECAVVGWVAWWLWNF